VCSITLTWWDVKWCLFLELRVHDEDKYGVAATSLTGHRLNLIDLYRGGRNAWNTCLRSDQTSGGERAIIAHAQHVSCEPWWKLFLKCFEYFKVKNALLQKILRKANMHWMMCERLRQSDTDVKCAPLTPVQTFPRSKRAIRLVDEGPSALPALEPRSSET
jgi:hypothetical protein